MELVQLETARRVSLNDELRRDGEEAWRPWIEIRAEHGIAPPELSPPTDRPVIAEAAPERNRGLELLLPVNRSPLAIIAPYLGLFGIAMPLLGPIAVVLGVMAWRGTKPDQPGRVRAVVAIVLGVVGTLELVLVVVALLGSLIG
jgi:hypothetical protein